MNNLTSECNNSSDLQVDYYATILPDKLPIDIGELNKAIEEFPSRMKDINNGKGVPITVIIIHLVFSFSVELCFLSFIGFFDFVDQRECVKYVHFCSVLESPQYPKFDIVKLLMKMILRN